MFQAAATRTQPEVGPHAAELQLSGSFQDSFSGSTAAPSLDCACKTLFAWKAPASPHLAAQREGKHLGQTCLHVMRGADYSRVLHQRVCTPNFSRHLCTAS